MPDLSPTLLEVLQTLRAAGDYTTDELREMVRDHLSLARERASRSPFVDLAKAEAVGAACLALLEERAERTADERAWIAAACLYFVESRDEDEDFESLTGFDDDAEVVAWVAEKVGLGELAPSR